MPRPTPQPEIKFREPDSWIACAIELPDDETTVLIYCAEEDPDVWIGYHDGGTWRTADGDRTHCTHWMPFPAAPEE